jgi:hypothetical protein
MEWKTAVANAAAASGGAGVVALRRMLLSAEDKLQGTLPSASPAADTLDVVFESPGLGARLLAYAAQTGQVRRALWACAGAQAGMGVARA